MRRALYLALRLVTRYGHLVRRRFTGPGRLVLIALVATATIGVDTTQTLGYQLFAFAFFLILFALAQSWSFRPRLRVTRTVPGFATAGEAFSYRVRVHNEGQSPEQGLRLLEDLPDPRPSYQAFARALTRKSTARSWLRRLSVWDRWQRLIEAERPARTAVLELPPLPAGGSVELKPELTPTRRGTIRLEGLSIARPDRLGLCKSFASFALPDSVLVLPKRYHLPPLTLPGTRMYHHGGMTLATSVGDSEEFIGLRDYRPGDPVKQIHWKSFARIGRPVVKEHQDEFFERHALVLDTFTEGQDPAVFEEAISIAASFAAAIETHECLLDLLFVGAQTYCFTAGRGQLHTESMLEILAHTRGCEDQPFSSLEASILERRSLLSGCILVLLGYGGQRRRLVEALRATALPLIALAVGEQRPAQDADPAVRFLPLGRIREELAAL